jgi:hypothetical protein
MCNNICANFLTVSAASLALFLQTSNFFRGEFNAIFSRRYQRVEGNLKARTKQSDQDEFVKKSPKMWPNPFLLNVMHNLHR